MKLRFLGDEAALGDAWYACTLVRSASPTISVGDADRTREQEMGEMQILQESKQWGSSPEGKLV